MSEPIAVTLASCVGCPFRRCTFDALAFCMHPAEPDREIRDDTPPPAWCPLRTAPVLLRVEAGL